MAMNNKEVSEILEEVGTLLELREENPFKCRAFHNAARVVGAELDKERQLKLVDDYITELGAMSPAADGNGERKEG